jgi:hypothetical protein
MKAVISLATLFGCALSLDAQITAALNRLSDGSIEVRIRNDSAVSLTAFAIRVDHATTSGMGDTRRTMYIDRDTVYVDTAIDASLRALQPAQEHAYKPHLRGRGPAPLPQVLSDERKQLPKQIDLSEYTVIISGVFADGNTSGDTGLVTRLMLRRSNMLLVS